jgi:hypothetical protein
MDLVYIATSHLELGSTPLLDSDRRMDSAYSDPLVDCEAGHPVQTCRESAQSEKCGSSTYSLV